MRRPLLRRSVVAATLGLAAAGLAAAQDLLTVGSASAVEPGATVELPLLLQDRSGTALGGDAASPLRIQALTLTVEASPAAAVESVAIVRSGLTAELGTIFETQVQAGGQWSWIVSFVTPLPLTVDGGPPGDEVGRLRLKLAAGVTPGSLVRLDPVAETTALANGTGTVLENATNGQLGLFGGTVGVGDTAFCLPSATALCLKDQRFRVEVTWKDFSGGSGVGHAVPLTGDTGTFWFFDEKNLELVVKVLDGTGFNGHFWVFYGSLSNVEYTMTVTDTATRRSKSYFNPASRFASAGDIEAFDETAGFRWVGARQAKAPPEVPPASPVAVERPTAPPKQGTCSRSDTNLCLNRERFRVEVTWTNFQGTSGVGHAIHRTDDTGMFWFFDPANVELLVKALDGTGFNGHYWIFYGALSNVRFTLTVTDTATDTVKVYENPAGVFASMGDIEAF